MLPVLFYRIFFALFSLAYQYFLKQSVYKTKIYFWNLFYAKIHNWSHLRSIRCVVFHDPDRFVALLISYTLCYPAWWCWREDPGNHSCWVHLQHWWLHLAAGEGRQFQALWHPASHVHSPQRGGRRAHISDSQGTNMFCNPGKISSLLFNSLELLFFMF